MCGCRLEKVPGRQRVEIEPSRRARPRRLAGLLAAALLAAPAARDARAGTLQPPPQQVALTGSAAALPADVGFEGSNASSRMTFLLAQLASALGGGGFTVSTGSAAGHAVAVRFQRDGDPLPAEGIPAEAAAFTAEGDEGYRLSVTRSGGGFRVVVASATDHGLWNGAMTLRQLLLDDDGAAEATLAPQAIRDYADHAVRASMPYDFEFTQRNAQNDYVVSSGQTAILDRLAHLKIDTVIFPTRTIATDPDQWSHARTGLAALQRAAADRFIDLIPSLGTLQSDWAPTYRDGWWVRDEPMRFDAATGLAAPDDDAAAGRRSGNLVTNGGFETASGGTPAGWTVSGSGLPGAAFTRDTVERASGAASMRLDATAGNAAVTLAQSIPGPLAAGHYLVSARFKTQAVTTTPPRLTARAIVGGKPLSPSRYLSAQLYTVEWSRYQGILRIPYGQVADRIELSIAWESGAGTQWTDDVEVTRIDADLRNVLRGAYDVRVTSPDRATIYRAGADYTITDGGFDSVYAPELTPTRLVRAAGGAIAPGARVLVSYDKNLYAGVRTDALPVQTSRAGEQGLDLCSARALTDLYGPGLVRLLWDLPSMNPDLPPKALFLASDEIRGFNRGGACRGADGAPSLSNARRLAAFLDAIASSANLIRPGVTLYLWGDMLTPAHNGAIPSYQVDQGDPVGYGRDLGGVSGMTYCALMPAGPGCAGQGPGVAIDDSLHPIAWWPSASYLFQKAFEMALLDGLQRPFLVDARSEADLVEWDRGIRDSAALAAALPSSAGLLDAYDIRAGALELKASLAWNDEWVQRLYEPFEFAAAALWGLGAGRPSAGDYGITNGSLRADETCAAPQRFRPEADKTLPAMNGGGVCLDSPGATLRLPAISVDNSVAYRVSFQSRASAALAGTLRLRWRTVHAGEVVEERPIAIGAAGGDWTRSRLDVPARASTGALPADELVAEIVAPGAAKIDDVMVWEERPGCPLGSVVASVPPVTVNASGAGATFNATVAVTNSGCHDLRILSIGSVPDAGIWSGQGDPLPIVVPAGKTESVVLGGTTPAFASLPASVWLYLETNDPGAPYLWVSVTVAPLPACGLLGAEALAPVVAAASVLRRARRRPSSPGGTSPVL